MVRLFNPVSGKYEFVDDYHYFDVMGEFPQSVIRKSRKKKK